MTTEFSIGLKSVDQVSEHFQIGTASLAKPGTLLADLMAEVPYHAGDEGYQLIQHGVDALVDQLMMSEVSAQRVDRLLVDHLIETLDQRLSAQLNLILHHPEFQQLEGRWRSLKFLVARTDFRENIKIDVLNVSKSDLEEDFLDASEIQKSGLYQLVYSGEYGQFGGEPYGLLVSDDRFDHSASDMQLLQSIASVAAMAHTPFLAAASPRMFGVSSMEQLPHLKELKTLFEGPLYTKWRSFRDSEDARYVGLTLPSFLLRQPYGREGLRVKSFDFQETIMTHHQYLWGSTAFALASRVVDSFAKFRWSPNIIGPSNGGAVDDLPLHHYRSMGDIETKIPTEVLISDRREFELSEAGFIPLIFRKGSDNASFFSANSAQLPRVFGTSQEGKAAELNFRLGTQLPYMFIVCRIAHYLKVLQREQLGAWREAIDLERELNQWISQYVANQENAPPEIRSRKPLREAKISVSSVEGDPGWYRVDIAIRPHFKYMGSDIVLSLAGRLDLDGHV